MFFLSRLARHESVREKIQKQPRQKKGEKWETLPGNGYCSSVFEALITRDEKTNEVANLKLQTFGKSDRNLYIDHKDLAGNWDTSFITRILHMSCRTFQETINGTLAWAEFRAA